MSDVDRLRSTGYERAGQWDLGMILDHLAKSVGAPFAAAQKIWPWPLGPLARFAIHRFARREKYPSIQLPVPQVTKPAAGANADLAYASLTSTVEKLRNYSESTIAFPPFGTVLLDDFVRVQLLHGAHHLGFLKPSL